MFDRRNTSGHRISNALQRLLTCGLLAAVAMLLAVGTGGDPFAQETDAVAPLVQKQPLPNRAARVEAEAALGKLFSRQFTTAKTPAQKAVLAGKLLDHGLRETDKPAQRCVALDLARRTAEEAGDLDFAMKAAEATARHFEVDVFALKAKTLAKLAKSNRKPALPEAWEQLTRAALTLSDEARSAGESDAARRIVQRAMSLARKSGNQRLMQQANRYRDRLIVDTLFEVEPLGEELEGLEEPESFEELDFYELDEFPIEKMELEELLIDEDESMSRRVELAPFIDVFEVGPDRGLLRHRKEGVLTFSSGPRTRGSEEAVFRALKWLAAHQMPDGGWSFNHQKHPGCAGKCGNPGSLGNDARVAATALAILPFLGAGQTHKEGKYKENVENGLKFLVARMKQTEHGGSLHEKGGMMYSHGLASIVLCEAYAMTHDKGLSKPAQAALDYIAHAQDPVGGGWRYNPRQPGDTSVTGWQLLALKSGHTAYLRISPPVVKKAYDFLDSVQADGGAKYGYTQPGSGQATTAIGLLCRMYLGWKRDDPRLVRGVEWLSAQGPSKGNMYYNYYATQVIHHFDGLHEKTIWKKWNDVMRDQLVDSQVKDGHEAGSWHQRGDHGADRGGRLYVTAMSTMILEVYYRHLPIYRKPEPEEDFPE